MVCNDEHGNYILVDECSPKGEARGCLQTVFEDGKLVINTCLDAIRERVIEGIKRGQY